MKKSIMIGFMASAIFLSNSCSNTNLNNNTDFNNINSFANVENSSNKSQVVEDFIKNVNKIGGKVNDDQLKLISKQRHVSPNGKFASRPARNYSAEKNLEVHFQKHKKEFKGVNSAEEYLNRVVEFQKRQSDTTKYYFDINSFKKNYQSNVVKHDSKTKEFSAMRADGAITTYYINYKVSSKRFVLVPENFVFN